MAEAGSSMDVLLALEWAIGLLAVLVSLLMRPWRMLSGQLLTPALAATALLPWLWLLPQRLPAGMQVQFSGASLLVLMLGWPLAIPVLTLVALMVWGLGQQGGEAVLSQWVWVGVVPATVALLLGAALRRWLPPNPFVYTLGRGFFGHGVVGFRCRCD